MSRSYWMEVFVETEQSKAACKSWFPILADGLTPYKSEILCDAETDREKKIRAFMTDERGLHYKLERTLGGHRRSISRKRIPTPSGATA